MGRSNLPKNVKTKEQNYKHPSPVHHLWGKGKGEKPKDLL